MRTLRELLGLARDAGTLWWRHLPPLLGWFSVGYAVNELTGHASTLLPVEQRILGTTIIILGIVAWVACLVLAVRSLEAPDGQDPRWRHWPRRWGRSWRSTAPGGWPRSSSTSSSRPT